MRVRDTTNSYERVALLREQTWQLLSEFTVRSTCGEPVQEITVGLADAANRLGSVERCLLRDRHRNGDGAKAAPAIARAAAPAPRDTTPEEPMTAEAAIVLALAEGSVILAGSTVDEAERWLHVLRAYGNVGRALKALGMIAGQLSTYAEPSPRRSEPQTVNPTPAVAAAAAGFAAGRGASLITTADVLFAVLLRYGPAFDRALYGATSQRREDLFEALAEQSRVAAS